MDFRHRFLHKQYEVSGSVDHSAVSGSRAAILGLQTDAVHFYQRPDAGLPLDSNSTLLTGDAEEFKFDKVGGQHLMFETAYQRRSAGLDQRSRLPEARGPDVVEHLGGVVRPPRDLVVRSAAVEQQLVAVLDDERTAARGGIQHERARHVQEQRVFQHRRHGGQLGTTYDDRDARGGPAFRQDSYISPWASISGDDRRAVVPLLSYNYFSSSAGRNTSTNLSPEIDVKTRGRFSSAFAFTWSHNITDNQWYGNYADSANVSHYTFAHLDQYTSSATIRLNFTFTPNVSVQAYMQPFVSKGKYTNVRAPSATPRAASYDGRYSAYGDTSVTNNPGGFNFKEFQSNLVFRWEYSPGSTLFVVWNEGRQGSVPLKGARILGVTFAT